MHVHADGRNRYSVTVVDYGNVEQLHAKRLEGCKAYPNLCTNPFNGELRGAIDYAAWGLMKKAARLTHYAYYNSDRVEGRQLQFVNPDTTQTFAAIHMHRNRLYVLEGTVPAGMPPPALFQQSMGFVDQEGRRIRYESTYSNMYPAPPMERQNSLLSGFPLDEPVSGGSTP
jgi:hypothetical protein